MPLPIKDIIGRHQKALSRKDNWRSIYEDCYRYALPQRNLYDGFYEGGVPGQNKMNVVFDSTAIDSTQRFANKRNTRSKQTRSTDGIGYVLG